VLIPDRNELRLTSDAGVDSSENETELSSYEAGGKARLAFAAERAGDLPFVLAVCRGLSTAGNSVGNLPRRFTGLVCILQLFFWLLHPCPH
jgi:hypothetical protein